MRTFRLLRATLFTSLTVWTSVAHAVPYMPTTAPASIDTLAIVAPEAGVKFSVVLGSRQATYAQVIEEGQLDSAEPMSSLNGTATNSVFATRQGTDVRVASGAQTFRFDPAASPPKVIDAVSFDTRRALGLGESASGTPKVALWSSLGLEIASVGSPDRPKAVATLDQQSLPNVSGFWTNDTFGVFAYAGSDGTKVVLLDALGEAREGAPLTLEGVGAKALMATPIGSDVVVTRFAAQAVSATRIAPDGKVVEEKKLGSTTIGVVADPKAPGGPDALIVTQESGNLALTWWSEVDASGTAKAPRLVGEKVSGTYSAGACSANGCLLGFTAGGGPTLVWVGRDGSSKVRYITPPEEPTGASQGGSWRPMATPYETSSNGCSAASTDTAGGLGTAGFFGAAVMLGMLRRKRERVSGTRPRTKRTWQG